MIRKTPAPYEADFEEWVGDLRGRLFRTYGQHGVNWSDVAHTARLNPVTVSNFAHEITKKPHANTLFRLSVALGWNPNSGWPVQEVSSKKLPRKKKK